MAEQEDLAETLQVCLLMLDEEIGDQERLRATLLTLTKITQNAKDNPTDEKFRRIRKENKTFNSRVWSHEGAQQLMLATGWVEVDDCVVLTEEKALGTAVEEIQKYNSTLPSATTPVPVVNNVSTQQARPSQRELTEKERIIAEQRKQQVEDFKRQKAERKRIADKIKADREETKNREVKDSRARELNFGARVNKLDLNEGGG